MTVTIAHIFGAMDRGGAELRTLGIVPHVPGVRHLYVTLSGRRGELADGIEATGGLVLPCRLSPAFPVHFWRLLRSHRPAVVHSNVATFSGVILMLARAAGVPRRVAHFRSDGDQHGNGWRRRLQRRLMRGLIRVFATDVIGNAPGALAFARPPGEDCAEVGTIIPDGVVLGQEPVERHPAELRVLHVARTLPTKRRERAVEVLAAGRAAGLPLRLVLVGAISPEEVRELGALADRLGVRSALELSGPTAEVAAALREADALLVTSTREGLPGVVLEALAEGCPVVSTDLPGAAFIAQTCIGLRLVPVAAADDVWVSALQALRSRAAPTRHVIWQSFASSPFTLDHAAKEMEALWRAPV